MLCLRKVKQGLCLLLAVLLFPAVPVAAAQPEAVRRQDVLLVCDAAEELSLFSSLLAACGMPPDAILTAQYNPLQAEGYKYLVTTTTVPLPDAEAAGIPALCLGDGFSSGGGVTFARQNKTSTAISFDDFYEAPVATDRFYTIENHSGEPFGLVTRSMGRTSPFAVFLPQRVYVPYYRATGVSVLALGAVLQLFLENSGERRMYVMLDEVYPFSDLGALSETGRYLYEQAIPYIVRIMPVYANLDYPAFDRYAQVLRFLQSHGASIVVHAPLEDSRQEQLEPVEQKMRRFYDALDSQGVVYWEWEIEPYPLSLAFLEEVQSTQRNFGTPAFDTVLQLPLSPNEEEMKQAVQNIINKWLPLGDYRRNFTQNNLPYREFVLDEEYIYTETTEAGFSGLFSAANTTLLWLVGISLVLFFIFLAVGRRLYRRKFF